MPTVAPKLDQYDLAILHALQQDGRMTKVALAERVNLSPSPCWERLKKLESAGFITGYTAQVDIRKIAPVTEVLVQITLSGHRAEDFRTFETAMQDRAEVRGAWALGGGVDYILRLVVSDVDAYQRLMDDLLADDRLGIEKYFGYIVTKTIKTAPDPLPPLKG
ncbi:Lrp/AsnC family transcriptional regulator of ectoine degradation [Sagittula marina]|uniref:Lrp/AsnC family transcriptional regulator of ectoine degradation n=1 Tax=Sagittula marina TaxID=943940 RepID=A0A7W6GT14_9RHOB|nr:Lrp/AsnC family transcriptional regulator [Sagittula marina]MBB3986585.1 Lrp/AsnC family transcriptional regulator of ectoine degradation [Sagittula marina]